MIIIIYEIWMKSFMPCQARMMMVSTRHLGLNLCVRKRELVLEHFTQMEIGVQRTKRRAIKIEGDCELNVIVGIRRDGVDGVVIMEMEH
jgi:hypothetical protein